MADGQMTVEEMTEVLIDCFMKQEGCIMTPKEGEVLEIMGGTLRVVGIDGGFTGDDSEGNEHTVMLVDVKSLKAL